MSLTVAYMLTQLSSLPVAISLPTLANHFDTTIDDTAWIVIIYLLMMGSLVLLAARLGDHYGHARVFFAGLLISTLGSGLIVLAQELWHVVMLRAITGLGSALVMGNANAILASTFTPDERGRAFAIPIIGARFGTLAGLAAFGLFLQFFDWRLVFLTFLPLGFLAIALSVPMLRHIQPDRSTERRVAIDWAGSVLLPTIAVVLILSGSHLHGGEESFVSSDGLAYHLPMHILFLVLLITFVVVERRVDNPVIDLRHFRVRPFSLSLGSNVTYHSSMMATMTLVPILVEEGYGMAPIFVTVVLLPTQTLGLFMPLVAGWIYDKHQPKLLRPLCLVALAGGFLLLGLSASHATFWTIPLLMLPISIATNMFNPVNNAAIMNSLPLEHRGIASGMLETTREMGHALGATAAAGVLALALPAAVELLSAEVTQPLFIRGFQASSLMVVIVLLFGATLAYLQQWPGRQPQPSLVSTPSSQTRDRD